MFFWISVRVCTTAASRCFGVSCCCHRRELLTIGLLHHGPTLIVLYFCLDGGRLRCRFIHIKILDSTFLHQKSVFFSDYLFYGRALFSISFGLFPSPSPLPLFHLNTLLLHGRAMQNTHFVALNSNIARYSSIILVTISHFLRLHFASLVS